MKNVVRKIGVLFRDGVSKNLKDLEKYKQIKSDIICLNQKINNARNYLLRLNPNEQNAETTEIIKFVENNNLYMMYAHDFIKEYNPININVLTDEECNMNYVVHNNKRLYFPQAFDTENCRNYYCSLCVEQDHRSPHRYDTPEYSPKIGDVIADIGAAEGVWALAHVETAGKIYLFECEQEWITALQKTFEPWKDKVEIVNKFISDTTNEKCITFDDFIKDKEINVIKADIEGAEQAMLRGCAQTLSRREKDDLKLLLCTYHKSDDAENIKSILEESGFATEFSKGYLVVYWDDKEPYLRKGVIRAQKKNKWR
ncbi:MAG: FkbM family methyltransferase [Chitinivibrionia bacterium]|nr:FkbM family methyltransferase [Chitinivibrionia bacterium]